MHKIAPLIESDTSAPSPYNAPSRLTMALRWFKEKAGWRAEGSIKEIIEEALDDASANAGSISAEEKSILKNMIHFGELTVRDVMVPRGDIMAVERSVTLTELKQHVITIGHTRIPVYTESLDVIEGFIHVKDLFPHLTADAVFNIGMVLREILFIPPSMKIVDLLLKMRVSGCHIAIVVDEFGGTDGMLTMEDLFEELVGEIQDEHDGHESSPSMQWLGDYVVEADARVTLGKLEEALGEQLSDEEIDIEIDTLGGLIFSNLGRIPVRGEMLMLKANLKAEILMADPRRIHLVRITRITV